MIERIDVGRVRAVLDGLIEQPVARLDHATEARTFTLVVRWPSCAAGADIAFARFVFSTVREIRVLGRDLRTPVTLEAERSLVMAPTFVPESHRGRAIGLAFHGGTRIGGVAFEYETVEAHARHARSVDGRMRDLASGAEITWDDPFGG